MIIPGLVPEDDSIVGGIPRLGKIRKGSPKRQNKNGTWIVGTDLDHFRITLEPQYEALAESLVAIYGDKPEYFDPVLLAGSTLSEAIDMAYEEWTASETLMKRCDGEHIHVWYQPDTGYYSPAKLPCAASGPAPCDACRLRVRVNIILPDLMELTGVFGYFTLETGSIKDTTMLIKGLKTIEGLAGTLAGVELVIGRAKTTQSVPKTDKSGERTGERMKINRSLLYISINPEYTKRHILPLMRGEIKPQLPATAAPPAPEVDTAALRASLGAGGSRRLVEPEIAPKPPNEAIEYQPGISPEDAQKLESWSLRYFNLQGSEVLEALDVYEYAGFTHGILEAQALVAAYAAGYDETVLGKITSVNLGLGESQALNLYEVALGVCQEAKEG